MKKRYRNYRVRGLSLKPLVLLLPYLWPRERLDIKLRVVAAVMCLLLATAATTVSPLFLADATDRLIHTTKSSLALTATFGLIVAYAVSRVLMQVLSQLRDLVFSKVLYHAMNQVGARTIARVQDFSLRFHLERKTGGLARAIVHGMGSVNTFLSYAVFNTIPILLQLIIFTGEMVWKLNVWIALAALASIIAYIAFTIWVTHWVARMRRAMNDSDAGVSAQIVDSLLNYETVKYFGGEGRELSRFRATMARFTGAIVGADKALSVLNCGQAAIMALGMATVMTLTARGIADGTFTVGAFVMGNAILMQLYVPLTVMGTVYREIIQGLADSEAMFVLLALPQEVADKPGAKDLAVNRGEIRFDDVCFAYEPGNMVLRGVSFRVPAGKTVAIVGPSGAGKSTISRILNRFYDITGGSVTIDGQDIGAVTQASLREAIGVVPQDPGLFNDTVGYNIAYGLPGASQADIEAAARMAQIDTFIRSLPLGYDTPVGERGLKLSGGEKQRVALARAILKNAPILLLDEATSALDTHAERAVQAALALASRRQTTLIIAHRLSTVVDADEILVLDQGVIAERGTHRALLAKNGLYAALWNKQKETTPPDEGEPLQAHG